MATIGPEVTIIASLQGTEQVNAGFASIGDSASNMGDRVANSTNKIDVNWKRLALTSAGLMVNMLQISDIATRMAAGQMDLSRGAVMLGLNFLQLGTQIWTIVSALKSAAVAQALVQALSGPTGWAMLAGAAAVMVGVYALISSIPSKQSGGYISSEGLYHLHAGEYVLPRGAPVINITINGARSPQATGDAVLDALQRAGVA